MRKAATRLHECVIWVYLNAALPEAVQKHGRFLSSVRSGGLKENRFL